MSPMASGSSLSAMVRSSSASPSNIDYALQPMEFDSDGCALDNLVNRAVIFALSNPDVHSDTIVAIYKNSYELGYVAVLNEFIRTNKHKPVVDVNERVDIADRLHGYGIRIEQRGDGEVILSDAHDIYEDRARFCSVRCLLNPILSKKVTQLVWDYSSPNPVTYPLQFGIDRRCVNGPVKTAIYDAFMDHHTDHATIAKILGNAYEFGYLNALNNIIKKIGRRHVPGALEVSAETGRLLKKKNIQVRQLLDRTVRLTGSETIYYDVARFRDLEPELSRLFPYSLAKMVIEYESTFRVLEENQGMIMEALSGTAHDPAYKRQIFIEAIGQDRCISMNPRKFTLNKLLVQFVITGNIINLRSVDLSGLCLPWVALERADLCLADLRGAFLAEGYFMYARFSGADLTGANLYRAKLHMADLSRAVLINVNLEDAILFNANLTDAVLTGAQLKGARLNSANLTRADLQGVDLSQTDLTGCILTDTKLGKKGD